MNLQQLEGACTTHFFQRFISKNDFSLSNDVVVIMTFTILWSDDLSDVTQQATNEKISPFELIEAKIFNFCSSYYL
jgi:hypothetical protein